MVYVHVDKDGIPHDANVSAQLAVEMGPGREGLGETVVRKYLLHTEAEVQFMTLRRTFEGLAFLLRPAAEACSDPELAKIIYAKLAELQLTDEYPIEVDFKKTRKK